MAAKVGSFLRGSACSGPCESFRVFLCFVGFVDRKAKANSDVKDQAKAAVAELKRLGTKETRDGMARYAIPSDNAFGVPVGQIRDLGKRLGRNHELAQALWDSGWYEARMLATFVAEPALVTPAQMDRWCKDFDNWAICDTACFHLFDKTPHAFKKVSQWSKRRDEFVKRAAFALLASLALHDKKSDDRLFAECLPLIEKAATDDRNFVKKGVSLGPTWGWQERPGPEGFSSGTLRTSGRIP